MPDYDLITILGPTASGLTLQTPDINTMCLNINVIS